ncbi:Serine/threonine-protein kinase DCLK1 (Doublecortin domain-containing protein 3A) (Doublecortin-like and CAM kinase-like 1) (Doublecortin-like kinase 1) [Durusdinium trenchii]|uniref:Serine/threonine-protein kinase DCLK1 (Doublecortin domain-containing protein 3A) (Doublecortin-like and CAM kinase-like 1) (Doublecortin-like kinase 1) n=1 Tax=Durusdinium trenchii TaxID=1381693 RepID=A0ABP0Q3H9_9DINO
MARACHVAGGPSEDVEADMVRRTTSFLEAVWLLSSPQRRRSFDQRPADRSECSAGPVRGLPRKVELDDSETTEELALAVQVGLSAREQAGELGRMAGARLARWASLLVLVSATVVLDRPDSEYQGQAENCTKLFVDSTPFDELPEGLNQKVHPRKKGLESAQMLTVRAVFYEPQPVGLNPSKDNDLYTSAFRNMHERDLYIMRRILKANAVRLAPWDPAQDHSGFLKLCQKYGLYVIPSFDLSFFLSESARLTTAFGLRAKEVWEGFQKFMVQALQDAEKMEGLILMWSVNFGLNLNETTDEGPRSPAATSLIRDEYFELLRAVREAQWVQECGSSRLSCPQKRFKRPLGIPLLLDSVLRLDNVGWYIGFAETIWGTWPTDELSLAINESSFNQLRPLGAFDVWIAEAQPPTGRLGQKELLGQLSYFNATVGDSDSGYEWKDLSTQTLQNPEGATLCKGCTYPTQKLVLAQYGFAAEAPLYGSATESVDPALQQRLTGEVYAEVLNSSSCAEGGFIIDEWVDDWGRSVKRSCPGSVFQHPHQGPCDEVRPGRTINQEWFGLNGQYTFLSFHCLDPRYHREHPTKGSTIGSLGFRFEQMIDPESAEEMIWKQLPGGYCAVMHESWWLLLLNVGLLLCGACLEIFYLCHCCCFRKSGRPNVSRPLGRLQQAGNGLLDAECGEGRDVISLELGCVAAAPNGFEVATAQAEVFIPLPMQIVGEANVQGVTSVLSRVWRRCRLEAHGYSFQRKDMGCGASIAPEAASSCLSGDGQPQGPPEGSGIPPAQNASEVSPEENWAWSKTVLERFTVQGTDVLGVGNFSMVRRGVEISTGKAVAVKALKACDQAKFRREVFLFEALFLVPRELSSVSPRSRYQTSPTVLMGTEEYGQRGLASKPQEFFVELLAHSDLTASEEMWSVLELGTFTLHDLILAAKDAARDKKLHCLQKEEQLTRALHHITAALAFLHSRFFVHGDLKPQNVMWFETLGRWKLIDMDGLRVPSELVDMRDADFYTAIYAAPELAAAVAEEGPLRLSRSLDIWAGGLCVLEMKLFKPLLQEKFEHFCTASADGEGLMDFFRWLGSVDDPIEETSAVSAVVSDSEVLQVVCRTMLLVNPLERFSPARLLEDPGFLRLAGTEEPVQLEPPKAPVAAKPKTAWQLFQEAHRPEVEEQGLRGAKALQELHRRWKALQAEGGEELQSLLAREAELREKPLL